MLILLSPFNYLSLHQVVPQLQASILVRSVWGHVATSYSDDLSATRLYTVVVTAVDKQDVCKDS